MVYPGFMKNKTNKCHKCYTGCHGDDISDQEGGRFYPETRVKTGKNARQNFSFKGA